MDIPLLIAVVALLAWTLLPQLDHLAERDLELEGRRSYLRRLARWVNESSVNGPASSSDLSQ